MATDYVFAGPSLPAAEVRRLLPGCQVLPPIRHGDLIRLQPAPGDRVLIIDGLFLQAAPVRHKEILHVLAQGVTVAGASSMGALRAAELWPYGMRGVGDVFQLHRDLVVTSDDEVAVIHCSADEDYRPLSEPLVSMRIAVREARAAGAITADEEARLLALARAIPFRSRGYRMLDLVAREELGAGPAGRFDAWRREHARDAKADDARLLLRMAAAGDPVLRPAGPGDVPVLNPDTYITAQWAARFRGTAVDEEWASEADMAMAAMLLHPGFPRQHRLEVLARLGGTSWDDPRATELALASARSLGVDEHPDVPGGWLTRTDREGTSASEQLARLLVRAFGTVNHQGIPLACRGRLLADGAVRAWARQVVSAARCCNRLVPARHGERLRYRDEVVEAAFARVWQCAADDIEAAAWDRGIPGIRHFRRVAEPFVAYLKAGVRLDPPRALRG